MGAVKDAIVFIIFVPLLLKAILNPILVVWFGGSFGKILSGLEIVRPNGQKVGFWVFSSLKIGRNYTFVSSIIAGSMAVSEKEGGIRGDTFLPMDFH